MLIRVTKYKSNYNTLEKDISSAIIIDLENPAKKLWNNIHRLDSEEFIR